MWVAQYEQLQNRHSQKILIKRSTASISYATVIQAWQNNQAFRDFFIDLLLAIPFSAFRWETPAITKATVEQPFECVVLSSPELARSPDRQTFANYFQVEQPVVTFSNLGQDAILVVPCPPSSDADYSHLGAFIRQATRPQQHALWQAVGHAMAQRLDDSAVWLSTAGGGVAWLHVRLDNAPKYYQHHPYRSHP